MSRLMLFAALFAVFAMSSVAWAGALSRDNDANYVAYDAKSDQALKTIIKDKETLVSALSSMDRHGVSAQHYLAQAAAVDDSDSAGLVRLVGEVLADLRFGVTRDKREWDAQKDTVQRLMHQMVDCKSLPQCWQVIAARHPQYEPLQVTLAQYEKTASAGGWPKIGSSKSLVAGQSDVRVLELRSRLSLSGDYRGNASDTSLVYDENLVKAVKSFQSSHGLQADGVVGPATTSALNFPIERRISQLKLSLERLRRLPNSSDQRYVMVNIPSFSLSAYNGSAKEFEMDVVVGKKSRQTPLFDNIITTVGLNPTWTPTYKILSRDLLPKFQRDPGYAERGGYNVRDRYTGERLDPYAVDWTTVSARDVRVVQRSGKRNALGKVKFLLPDNDSIYLHDTSKPQLFSKSVRALSSGCVRLSEPKRFLDYIIASQGDERFAKLRSYYAGSKNKHIALDNPIRVRTTYFTAWVNDSGIVEFYDDIYSKDSRLELALTRGSNQFAQLPQ